MKVRSHLAAWLQSSIDFVYPWSCVLCGTTADRWNEPHQTDAFCQLCRERLTPDLAWTCQRCGAATGPHASADQGCTHCRHKAIRFDSLICLGMYDKALRQAILSAKWSFSSVVIDALACLLVEERFDAFRDFAPDLVIPVPQSWPGRLTRSFNSASQIATILSRALGVPADEHVLRRNRHTRPQKRVPLAQRYRNQQGAFRIRDAHMLRAKRVLLVDDVLTTGATCSHAAQMLKKHGASQCRVAVLARVLDSQS